MTLVDSLKQFDTFIRGGSIRALKRHMQYYDQRIAILNRDFKSILIDDASIFEHIRTLLINLGIPREQWDKYFQNELTVYQFFLALSQAGHLQMTYIVRIIDRKEKVSTLAIIAGIALPIGITAVFLTAPPLAGVLTFIMAFFASAISLPIIGLVKTTFFAVLNLYQIFSDIKQPLFNRLRDASFAITKAAINYVGYALWLGSVLTMTPVVASLFVISSLLDLGREVFCVIQHAVQYNKIPVGLDDDDLNTQRDKMRHDIGYRNHLNAAIINLCTAVAIIAIMAVLTFVPGGIAVSLPSIVALIAVYVTQYFVLRHNKRVMRDLLQNELSRLESVPPDDDEMELIEFVANDVDNNPEYEISSAKTVAHQRQVTTPLASTLPFFAHDDNRNIDDEVSIVESSFTISGSC